MSTLSLLATIPLALAAQDEPAPSVDAAADLFRTRCMACHLAPDPRFAVERAWIAQVADTA